MNVLSCFLLKRTIANMRDRLYRVALAWSGDAMLADDLVQEALTAAISNCHKLRDPDRVSPWLFTILHNCWNRHLRRRKPLSEFSDDIPSPDLGPMKSCESIEAVELVREAVSMLSPGQREVISLVELEGLSYCEVAQVLQVPIGTVMSRLHRARKALVVNFDKDIETSDKSGSVRIRRVK